MKKIANYLTLILLALLLLYYLVNTAILEILVGGLTFIVVILSILFATRINQLFGSIMLIIGGVILVLNNEPLSVWLEAITNNLALVSLIVVAPLLSIPVKLGQYDRNINNFILRYAKNSRQLYFIISILFFILSPLLNLGAIHLIHSIIEKLKLPNKFLGRVYLRSFFTANIWAPYFASVFLIIYFLEIPINSYTLYGIILGLSQLLVSYLLYTLWEKRYIFIKMPTVQGNIRIKKLIEFAIILISVIVSIFLFEKITEVNIIIIITTVIFIFTFIWSLYIDQMKQLFLEVKKFFQHIIPRNSNEIVLFLSAGFFGLVVSITDLGSIINTTWQMVAETSIFLVIVGTILVVMLFSFIGIHQIVTISIILTTVYHQLAGVSNLIMAMILLSSYSTGAIVSPVSPANLIVSNLIKKKIYSLIIQYNTIFAFLICIIHSLIIYFLYLWL